MSEAFDIFETLTIEGKTLQELQSEVYSASAGRYKPALSTIWKWKQLISTGTPPVEVTTMQAGTYVLTSAQYGAEVHLKFLDALKMYCQHNGAQLYVTGIRYSAKDSDDISAHVEEYLTKDVLRLTPDLVYAGDVNVLPTAARPLSGFDSYVRAGSGILPHPKMHMVSLPRLKGEPPRFLYSTGACTKPMYSDTKAGKIAEFHHVLGALVVHVNTLGEFFVRQLIADPDTGEFYDLEHQYSSTGVAITCATGIIWGDLHCEDLSPAMLETMQNINSALLPEWNICHDVLDFGGLSYHIKDNLHERARLYYADSIKLSAEKSLKAVSNTLLALKDGAQNVIVVPSNHDDHLKRWLRTPVDSTDFINLHIWYALNAAWIKSLMDKSEFHVLKSALELITPEVHEIGFLNTDESLRLHGIEVAQHGHAGPNGSRGTPNNFRGVGSKVVIGHTHSPGIIDGVYTVGCMCNLDMGYNVGPSSWSHTFCIVYPNGKRALVTIRNERRWK